MLKKVFLAFSAFLLACSTAFGGQAPHRIISLAPGLTEILFALGLGENIAGVTTYCDYPEEAREKPKVGGMSNPSLEAVLALKPDIVVLTTDGNPEAFERRLRSFGIKTYIFRARTIGELPDAVRQMGEALGAGQNAYTLSMGIGRAIEGSRANKTASQRKILFIIWPEPLTVAGPGTIVDDAINILGHKNIASASPMAYPKYSIEDVMRQNPDVIIIGSGHGIGEASERLLRRLKSIHSVKEGRVFYMSDSLYRLGPRIPEGIKEMDEILRKAFK
jgi:iron complex transport system substrate-binding protein